MVPTTLDAYSTGKSDATLTHSEASEHRKQLGRPKEKAKKKLTDMVPTTLDAHNTGKSDGALTHSEASEHTKHLGRLKEKAKKKLTGMVPATLDAYSTGKSDGALTHSEASEHRKQLGRLKEKDPEFYQFLEEHDKELLEFSDEETEEVGEVDKCAPESGDAAEKVHKSARKILTTEMVDSWCQVIEEKTDVGAIRSLLRAFRTACHYGDDNEDGYSSKFSVMSSSVFNKIMVFVLSKIDGIFRKLLGLPSYGGKKETILDMMASKGWKNHGYLVKLYLGSTLHVLNQMTDNQMISFTFRRLKPSAIFLAAFPNLLRKYIKVALHFWGTGEGALPVVSFLFLRDLCVRLGSDCLDMCFKGIYKTYVLNCRFVKASTLQHIRFLGNCVIELYGVDLSNAYQHAFVFIRQLATILRNALTVKTKEAFRKVYEWNFMNCLELWTGFICAHKSDGDIQRLAYPLTQIIFGAARLVPTARYFPLRLRCARLLNRISSATGTFIPVSQLLLDMLDFKELSRPPTGGIGTAVNLHTTLKVSKQALKTRAFQEGCVFSVVEQIGEHLAQWSYSVAFFELAFIPVVQLRSFCKSTKIERFRKETRELIRQVEANSEFTNSRRANIAFSLGDEGAMSSFLEIDKESGISPLSQFVDKLRRKAQERNASLVETSILVGAESSQFGSKISEKSEEIENEENGGNVEEGAAVFSSTWLPTSTTKKNAAKPEKSKKKRKKDEESLDEDVVGELEFSSDEEEPVMEGDDSSGDDDGNTDLKPKGKKQKQPKRVKPSAKKSKTRNFASTKKKRFAK